MPLNEPAPGKRKSQIQVGVVVVNMSDYISNYIISNYILFLIIGIR